MNLDFSSYLAAELEEQPLRCRRSKVSSGPFRLPFESLRYLLDLTKELSRDQEERSANLQQRGQERRVLILDKHWRCLEP